MYRSLWRRLCLTFKEIDEVISVSEGEEVHCVIALGYGVDNGKQHPLKPVEKFYEADGEVPGWFKAGMEAALLAPATLSQNMARYFLSAYLEMNDPSGCSASHLFSASLPGRV